MAGGRPDAPGRLREGKRLIATVEAVVREQLREAYAVAPPMVHVGDRDPLPDEAAEDLRAEEQKQLASQFNDVWSELCSLWARARGEQEAHPVGVRCRPWGWRAMSVTYAAGD
jgi:ribosomal protein L29